MKKVVEGLNPRKVPARAVKLFPAVIGFFFSFRLFFVLLTTHVFNAGPQAGMMLSLGLNYILLTIVVINSIGLAPRTLASITSLPCYRWVLCFLSFSGCSLIWSATSSLPAAVAFWCAMAADLAMVILILRAYNTLDVCSSIMKGYVYGACCIALIAWIMPAQSDLRLGDDEFLGPNQIGYACAFAAFFAQYLMRAEQGRWRVPAAFLAITLLRSLSKTTICAFVAGEAVIFMWDKSVRRKTKLALLLGTILIVAIFWGLLVSYYDVYTNAGDQAKTLTGRLGIWAYILDKSLDQPWIGHGFHSVWKVIPPFGSDQFEARHAHNELLQQFYAYGVAGIILLIALYGSLFCQVKKMPKSPLRALLLGLLVFVVVRGFADTEAFDLSLPLWAIAMFSTLVAEFHTNNPITPLSSFESQTAPSQLDNETFGQRMEAYDNPR